MDKAKIERINFLAKKSKTEGLTESEAMEQQALRKEYIASYVNNLKAQLENTYIVQPDGTKKKVTAKDENTCN